MKFNIFFLIGIGYILLIAGFVSAGVGKPVECSNDPVTWFTLLGVILVLTAPFIAGYFSGKHSHEL